jgi:hypothetical protein
LGKNPPRGTPETTLAAERKEDKKKYFYNKIYIKIFFVKFCFHIFFAPINMPSTRFPTIFGATGGDNQKNKGEKQT